VMDPITAYQIETMLQGVVQRGTGTAALVLNRPVAGKTGTTNEFRSAWFVGFTPDIVVGVFVGFDDNRSLGESETGAVDALPVFIEFMQSALPGTPVHDFKAPKNVKFIMVNGIREAFRPGTEPKAAAETPTAEGPVPYQQAFPGGPAPIALPPAQPPPPPPPKKAPADLEGLY